VQINSLQTVACVYHGLIPVIGCFVSLLNHSYFCRIASLGLAQSLDKAVSDVRTYGISKTSLFALFSMTDATTLATSQWVQTIFAFLGCYCVYTGLDCAVGVLGPASALMPGTVNVMEVMDTWYTQFKYTSRADR
jgi:hypothetical protein